MALRSWPSNRTDIFCVYCSTPLSRVRLNYNTQSKIEIQCKNCNRTFALKYGAQNLKDYMELMLDTDDLELAEMSCPLDGRKSLKYISEGVYVDPVDEDVDMDTFVQCNNCRKKFEWYGLTIDS